MKKLKLAGAVILTNERKLLLIHRNSKTRIQWELPGGKVEKDEECEAAAIRELKEELGVDINIIKYLGCDNSNEDNTILEYHWYLASIIEGRPKLMEEKFDELKYFSKNELIKRNDLSSNMKVLIKKIDIYNIINY